MIFVALSIQLSYVCPVLMVLCCAPLHYTMLEVRHARMRAAARIITHIMRNWLASHRTKHQAQRDVAVACIRAVQNWVTSVLGEGRGCVARMANKPSPRSKIRTHPSNNGKEKKPRRVEVVKPRCKPANTNLRREQVMPTAVCHTSRSIPNVEESLQVDIGDPLLKLRRHRQSSKAIRLPGQRGFGEGGSEEQSPHSKHEDLNYQELVRRADEKWEARAHAGWDRIS